MNVLSLFSGIGGLDLGLERAGMTVVGQVEIDPWCRKVLAKHWPEVPRHDDVRTAAEWWGGRGAPDLVCGGFPCQPVSLAGERKGQEDSRWLWPAFAATIRALRPRYILVENTPGLASLGMGDVVGDLAALGYDAEWDCIPACFVGAPHIRERIFLVGYPASVGFVGADQRFGEHATARHAGEADSQPAVLADADRSQGRIWTGWRQQLPQGGGRSRDADRWATEPAVGRMADGLPAELDRLRGLGNAVVPQVVEHIGRLILGDLEAAS